MSSWFPSQSQKKTPYKKSNWYTLMSGWPAKTKDSKIIDGVFTLTVNSPFKEAETRDGSPRGCDILAAVVNAWTAGKDVPLRLRLFTNEKHEGRQPYFRVKIGENDYHELCKEAGIEPQQEQMIEEQEDEVEEQRPKTSIF